MVTRTYGSTRYTRMTHLFCLIKVDKQTTPHYVNYISWVMSTTWSWLQCPYLFHLYTVKDGNSLCNTSLRLFIRLQLVRYLLVTVVTTLGMSTFTCLTLELSRPFHTSHPQRVTLTVHSIQSFPFFLPLFRFLCLFVF